MKMFFLTMTGFFLIVGMCGCVYISAESMLCLEKTFEIPDGYSSDAAVFFACEKYENMKKNTKREKENLSNNIKPEYFGAKLTAKDWDNLRYRLAANPEILEIIKQYDKYIKSIEK